MRGGEETPYLERFSANTGSSEKILLETFPFLIGRDDAADLQLDSGRVSREHARFQQEASNIVLRDLGSTNGTFVNGRRVDEHTLDDGDIVMFADLEFTFCANTGEASRVTATQVLSEDPATRQLMGDSEAIVLEVRRAQEMLTHRAMASFFQPIVGLASGNVLGYQAIEMPNDAATPSGSDLLQLVECQLGDRLRQVLRISAVADAARLPEQSYLLVEVHASEFGGYWLADAFHRLRRAAGRERKLAVQVPENAANDSVYFHELYEELKRLDVDLVYGSFSSGRGRILEHADRPPSFVKLDPSLVRFIDRSKRRQSQVENLVSACGELGVSLIADGVRSETEHRILSDLGCGYGQGHYFGPPRTAGQWLETCAA